MSSSLVRLTNTAIPTGSLVLVTGATGFIGAHISDQLLRAGYRVRGTSRDPTKSSWLAELFKDRYGGGKFELERVEDMTKSGAFDNAAQDVQGVIHSASDTSLSPHAQAVVPTVVSGALNAITSAYKSPTVERFVYTSSAHAAYMSGFHGTPSQTIDQSLWNDSTASYVRSILNEKKISNPYPGVPDGYMVYAASKMLAEQALWGFSQQEPRLVVNTVLPAITFGRPIDSSRPSSTAFIIQALFQSKTKEDLGAQIARSVQSQYFIDVQDNARLHVAALLNRDVEFERVLGCTQGFNWNQVLDVFRRAYPEQQFVENFDYEGSGKDETDVQALKKRSADVLTGVGYDGSEVTLEDSIKQAVAV